MKKLLLIILVVLLSSQMAVAQDRPVLQDEAAQTAWREDVDYLLEKIIDLHPEPFFRFSETEFQQAADNLKAEIPYLTENQIIMGLTRLAAMLDGHTYLFLMQERVNFRLYPIRLYAFEEGYYVVNAAPQYEHLIGRRMVQINGTDVQTVYDRLVPYSSTDNEYYTRLWVPVFMIMPEVLQAEGIIETLDQPQITFEDQAGERITEDFSPVTLNQYLAWNQGGMLEIIGLPQRDAPLYLTNKHENFWYTYLADEQTIYLQYNHIYSSGSGMRISGLASAINTLAEENTVQRLVIDLRHNGGGDNTTYAALINGLRRGAFNEHGKLFVILGRNTFSAAKDFALDLARNAEVIFVGEPSGGSPNNFGDAVSITLPNSRIQAAIAVRLISKARAEDTQNWIAPDVLVPITADDFFKGRDAALELILSGAAV